MVSKKKEKRAIVLLAAIVILFLTFICWVHFRPSLKEVSVKYITDGETVSQGLADREQGYLPLYQTIVGGVDYGVLSQPLTGYSVRFDALTAKGEREPMLVTINSESNWLIPCPISNLNTREALLYVYTGSNESLSVQPLELSLMENTQITLLTQGLPDKETLENDWVAYYTKGAEDGSEAVISYYVTDKYSMVIKVPADEGISPREFLRFLKEVAKNVVVESVPQEEAETQGIQVEQSHGAIPIGEDFTLSVNGFADTYLNRWGVSDLGMNEITIVAKDLRYVVSITEYPNGYTCDDVMELEALKEYIVGDSTFDGFECYDLYTKDGYRGVLIELGEHMYKLEGLLLVSPTDTKEGFELWLLENVLIRNK